VHSRAVWCAPPLKGHFKKWRGTTRNFSGASRRTGAPHYSFRRHCQRCLSIDG